MLERFLFALGSSRGFGEAVAAQLGTTLAPLEEREFEDGEHKARPLVDPMGRDAYVIHDLYGEPGASANDKLCRLLFFVGALKDAGATRVTVMAPYLAYARKDRRTKPHDPVTSRYVAQLFEAVGTDRLLALEVHNPAAFDNAFRLPTVHLEAREVLAAAAQARLAGRPAVVVSPDPGGAKRADRFRESLEQRLGQALPTAFMEKRRSEGVVTGDLLTGDVAGRVAVIVDDLISSGTTLLRAAATCRAQGACAVLAVVTHGLFATGAEALFQTEELERVIITNSVAPRMSEHWNDKVEVVAVEGLFAEAIRRLAGMA